MPNHDSTSAPLLALPFAVASLDASAATFRCGSALVSEGDRAVEVLRKCGEPAARNLIGYPRPAAAARKCRWRNGSMAP